MKNNRFIILKNIFLFLIDENLTIYKRIFESCCYNRIIKINDYCYNMEDIDLTNYINNNINYTFYITIYFDNENNLRFEVDSIEINIQDKLLIDNYNNLNKENQNLKEENDKFKKENNELKESKK